MFPGYPDSRVGEGEKEPGTHCLHMHQVPLVTCIYSAIYTTLINLHCFRMTIRQEETIHSGSLVSKSNLDPDQCTKKRHRSRPVL